MLSPAGNASLAVQGYLCCLHAMSTASEWRLGKVAKCAQDTADRSAYPVQMGDTSEFQTPIVAEPDS